MNSNQKLHGPVRKGPVVKSPEPEPLPKKRGGGMRKPGLWFSKMKVEVQAIRPAHRIECWVCKQMPKSRRLFIACGSGRNGWSEVYCIACGKQWFENKRVEAIRGWRFLDDATGSIRCDLVYSLSDGTKIPQPKRIVKEKGEA